MVQNDLISSTIVNVLHTFQKVKQLTIGDSFYTVDLYADDTTLYGICFVRK